MFLLLEIPTGIFPPLFILGVLVRNSWKSSPLYVISTSLFVQYEGDFIIVMHKHLYALAFHYSVDFHERKNTTYTRLIKIVLQVNTLFRMTQSNALASRLKVWNQKSFFLISSPEEESPGGTYKLWALNLKIFSPR